MPDVPRYPLGPPPEDQAAPRSGSRRSTYLLAIAAVAVGVLMVVLHLLGVLGPGGHS